MDAFAIVKEMEVFDGKVTKAVIYERISGAGGEAGVGRRVIGTGGGQAVIDVSEDLSELGASGAQWEAMWGRTVLGGLFIFGKARVRGSS